jgi:sulfur carrier protein
MKLRVNGKSKEVEADATLATLLNSLGVEKETRGVAVALNDTVVKKSDWPDTVLRDGDTVEVIRAIQGG